MKPEFISSGVIEANELFTAKKIQSKFKFLDLELENKSYENSKLNAFGIYFIFFKKKLIYIGSWCGNGFEAKDSVHKERWRKHIITVTTRFLKINFGPPPKKKNYLEKSYNEIFKDEVLPKYKKLRDKDYTNSFEEKEIYKDIIQPILNFKEWDKDYIKIIFGAGHCSSHNRFKFCDENWDYFKKCNEDNILDDFQFVYYKFEDLFNFVDRKYKNQNGFTKEGLDQIKKRFKKIFEKPLIKYFNPEVNKEYKPKKRSKEFISDNEIVNKLEEFFYKDPEKFNY
jgi:hypothetical protein